jgi:uncharacterized membrane protein (DUF2068 family)
MPLNVSPVTEVRAHPQSSHRPLGTVYAAFDSRDTLRLSALCMNKFGSMSDLHHRRQRHVLKAVASFECFKGIGVLLMGLAAIYLLHKDTWLIAESLLARLHIRTDSTWALRFLDFADSITDAHLWDAAGIAFAYAGLRFTEAYGLWKGRTWAEWVAFVSGTLLLPLEVRELFRGVTVVRVVFLIGNVAIVLYMLYVILENRRERRQAALLSHQSRTHT